MSSVEGFILEQPKKLQPMLKKLRELILSASPFIEEKLVYRIPFFYGIKRIFYINPHKNYVDLGFCNGQLLGENNLLETKNRAQVKTIRFYKLNEVNEDEILPVIHEAILTDLAKNKKEK